MFALQSSPRSSFIVSSKQVSQAFFTNRVSFFFCLAISSATSYDACPLGGNIQQDKSLTLQTRFMVSDEFNNVLWRDWDALSLNAASVSKASYS